MKLTSLLFGFIVAALIAPGTRAQNMRMIIQGVSNGGFDAWGYTYHIPGPPPYYTPGGIPSGMAFSLEFRYTLSAIGPDLDPSTPGWLHHNRPWQQYYSQPSDYPAFLSADLTLNGITVAVDTRWQSFMDYKPYWDSFSLHGSALRGPLDPNGGQHGEGVGLSLKLFGQAFDPGIAAVYLPASGFTNNGQVNARIYESNDPLHRAMGLYPAGRFTDGNLHWVEFQGMVTRVELSVATDGGHEAPGLVAVPEPSTYALLGSSVCAGLAFWRRRRRQAARVVSSI